MTNVQQYAVVVLATGARVVESSRKIREKIELNRKIKFTCGLHFWRLDLSLLKTKKFQTFEGENLSATVAWELLR